MKAAEQDCCGRIGLFSTCESPLSRGLLRYALARPIVFAASRFCASNFGRDVGSAESGRARPRGKNSFNSSLLLFVELDETCEPRALRDHGAAAGLVFAAIALSIGPWRSFIWLEM